jgi:hypothetical protein
MTRGIFGTESPSCWAGLLLSRIDLVRGAQLALAMAARPPMQARDSSGRQVSLLNDEPSLEDHNLYPASPSRHDVAPQMTRSNSSVSDSSSQSTPDLLRSNSYDSSTANDSSSPLTPSLSDFSRRESYSSYVKVSYDQRHERPSMYSGYPSKRHSSASVRSGYGDYRRSSYEDDPIARSTSDQAGSGSSSSTKRYPCRYKESHGCDKTFTTSGHASRHSKIHTAEKAVGCSFTGCVKKFTRADNMKQHLETHFKERSRSSASHKSSHSTSPSASSPSTASNSTSDAAKLTLPAGVQKKLTTGRSSRPASRASRIERHVDKSPPRQCIPYQLQSVNKYVETTPSYPSSPTSPLTPTYNGPLDMGGFRHCLPLQSKAPHSRSSESRVGTARGLENSSGLDALCVAVSHIK